MIGVVGDICSLFGMVEILLYGFVDVGIECFCWLLVEFVFKFVGINGIVLVVVGVVGDVGDLVCVGLIVGVWF